MAKLTNHNTQDTTARAAGILAALGVASVAELARVTGLPESDIDRARAYYGENQTAGTEEVGAHTVPAVVAQPIGADATSSLAGMQDRASHDG